MDRKLIRLVVALAALAAEAGAMGCSPRIGDKCTNSTDCSVRGDRVCDTSQPNGYCTLFNCTSNSCPNNAACVEFNASVPGCPYNDYRSPSRTGRTFCMASCGSDSDCRQSDGYMCLDPSSAPWNAVILDSNSSARVCLVSPRSMSLAPAAADAAVCAAGSSLADADVRAADDAATAPEASLGPDGAGAPSGDAADLALGDVSVGAPDSPAAADGGSADSATMSEGASESGATDASIAD
ncbi:MAG: hypothetical protein M3O50_18015 [Myxococcota bacterium]|nr:hypothetical protein [Myxococcota bacterium]